MNHIVTRPFVPFILNGRIYQWLYSPFRDGECLNQITIEIPMRYYPKIGERDWVVRQMFCTFVKKEQTIARIVERPRNGPHDKVVNLVIPVENDVAIEISYVCISLNMYYDNEGLPVAKAGKVDDGTPIL